VPAENALKCLTLQAKCSFHWHSVVLYGSCEHLSWLVAASSSQGGRGSCIALQKHDLGTTSSDSIQVPAWLRQLLIPIKKNLVSPISCTLSSFIIQTRLVCVCVSLSLSLDLGTSSGALPPLPSESPICRQPDPVRRLHCRPASTGTKNPWKS
jgi:hypothetical protein